MNNHEINGIFTEAQTDLNNDSKQTKAEWNLVQGVAGPFLLMEPYHGFTIKISANCDTDIITVSIFMIEDEDQAGTIQFEMEDVTKTFILITARTMAFSLMATYGLMLMNFEHDLNIKAIKQQIIENLKKVNAEKDDDKNKNDIH